MSIKPEVPEPLEHGHDENRRSILSRHIVALLALILIGLINSLYLYHQSKYLRRAGDWRLFWIGEALTGILLVYGAVQIFRKRS